MGQRNILMENRGLFDLNPLAAGWQDCPPGHTADKIRDYYMIHYVTAGRGRVERGGATFEVGAGNIFIVGAGERHRYTADEAEPWSYIWVCFNGKLAQDFGRLPTVLPYPHDTFRRLARCQEYGGVMQEYVTGCLFELYARLFADGGERDSADYAARARGFVDSLYMMQISVGQIAAQLSLDRRYLTRLFRARYGCTLQAYILRVRMAAAAEYMAQGHSAQEAGALCGYADSVNFYRMFKRCTGEGPARFKKRLREAAGKQDGTPQKIRLFDDC